MVRVAAIRGDVVADVEEASSLVVEEGEVHRLEERPGVPGERVEGREDAARGVPGPRDRLLEALRPGASLGQAGRVVGQGVELLLEPRQAGAGASRRPRAARPAWDRRAGIARRRPMPSASVPADVSRRDDAAASRPEPPTEDRARCRATWPRGAGAPRRTRRGARRAGRGRGPRRPAAITERRAWSSSVPPRSRSRAMPGPHARRCPFNAIASSRIFSTHVRRAANRAASLAAGRGAR